MVEQFFFVFLLEEAWWSNSSFSFRIRLVEQFFFTLPLKEAW